MNFQGQKLNIFKSVTYSDYVNDLKNIDKLNMETDKDICEMFLQNGDGHGAIKIVSELVAFEGLVSEFYFYDELTEKYNFLFIKITKNVIGPVWTKKIDYYT